MDGSQLRSAARAYALALCRAIAACRQLEQVLTLLTQGVGALVHCRELDTSSADAADEEVSAYRRALAAAAAAAAGQSQNQYDSVELVQHAFYSSTAFQEVSQVLLTGKNGAVSAHGEAFKLMLPDISAAHFPRSQLCCMSRFHFTVVAPDWLRRFSPDQRRQLFDCWFDQAPATALLIALVRYAPALRGDIELCNV